MKNKHKSASTIGTINKCLKSCVTLALKDGYVMKNYCTCVILPKDKTKAEKSTINAFSLDEQEKFMIAAKEKKLNIYFLIKTPIPSVLFV